MDSIDVLVSRADALVDLGRHDEALVVLAPALAANPGHVPALLSRARALINSVGGYVGVEAAKQAARTAPEEPYPHYLVAVAAQNARQGPLAVAAARRCLELDPVGGDGARALVSASAVMPELRSEAVALADAWVSRRPTHAAALLLAVEARLAGHRWWLSRRAASESKALLERVHHEDPANVPALLLRARVAQLRGNLSDALRMCRDALIAHPRDETAHVGLRGAMGLTFGVAGIAVIALVLASVVAVFQRESGQAWVGWGLPLITLATVGVVGWVVITVWRGLGRDVLRLRSSDDPLGTGARSIGVFAVLSLLAALAPWTELGADFILESRRHWAIMLGTFIGSVIGMVLRRDRRLNGK